MSCSMWRELEQLGEPESERSQVQGLRELWRQTKRLQELLWARNY